MELLEELEQLAERDLTTNEAQKEVREFLKKTENLDPETRRLLKASKALRELREKMAELDITT